MTPVGFPHSDTHGSTLVWQLTVLFRGLHRPSSPACPKASISCPESLIRKLSPVVPHANRLRALSWELPTPASSIRSSPIRRSLMVVSCYTTSDSGSPSPAAEWPKKATRRVPYFDRLRRFPLETPVGNSSWNLLRDPMTRSSMVSRTFL